MVRVELKGKEPLIQNDGIVDNKVITPGAARGILDSILWRPGVKWRVRKIHILTDMHYNRKYMYNTLDLGEETINIGTYKFRSVHYVIDAEAEVIDHEKYSGDEAQFEKEMKKRLSTGYCYKTPFFVRPDCVCSFAEWDSNREIPVPEVYKGKKIYLGISSYDKDFTDAGGVMSYYKPVIVNGCIDVRQCS